jgi:hypothetical protein
MSSTDRSASVRRSHPVIPRASNWWTVAERSSAATPASPGASRRRRWWPRPAAAGGAGVEAGLATGREVVAVVAAPPARGDPQASQNRAEGSTGWPQPGQASGSVAPHPGQNRAPSRTGPPHDAQTGVRPPLTGVEVTSG